MSNNKDIKETIKKLREDIKEIVDIASSVPDPFKEKCFEVLLNELLETAPVKGREIGKGEILPSAPPLGEMPISTQLRVFMQRTGVSGDDIKSIVMVANDEVHFIKEPAPSKIADGQLDWALLLALKNCILNNNLSVDPEEVRSICQEKGFYDSANFAAIFKRPKYAKLFKGPMEPQSKPQPLSNDGEKKLADLIRTLISSQS